MEKDDSWQSEGDRYYRLEGDGETVKSDERRRKNMLKATTFDLVIDL